MKTIIIEELHGIRSDNQRLSEIKIRDLPINEGGQGIIYLTPSGNHVVKIFKDREIYMNVVEICNKFNSGLEKRKDFEDHPSIIARPKFCFSGRKDGERVYGSVSVYLKPHQFTTIDQVFGILKESERMKICKQIAEAFVIFHSFSYVYVDISEDNIFVNKFTKDISFIDFESGGIIKSSLSRTNTIGKASGYEPPELILKDFASNFDFWVYLDWWGMAVLMFIVLTGFHPFIMFGSITQRTAEVLRSFAWPDIPKNLWNGNFVNIYDDFRGRIAKIPSNVLDLFRTTFNDGFFKPEKRIGPYRWLEVFNDVSDAKISEFRVFKQGSFIKVQISSENVKFLVLKINGWVKTLPPVATVILPSSLYSKQCEIEIYNKEGGKKKVVLEII